MSLKYNEEVYVRLLDEGSTGYRPVPAAKINSQVYLLAGQDIYDYEVEKWEFLPGSQVKVEERTFQIGGTHLVAKSFDPQDSNMATIYVHILNADLNTTFRPVPALQESESTYLLQGKEIYNLENEHWEFLPGSRVIAEERVSDGGLGPDKHLVAIKQFN